MKHHVSKKITSILLGILFISVGVIWGLNTMGITDINIFFDGWWTLFIIVPCLIGLCSDRESVFGNFIGLLIGVGLLLSAQDIIDFSYFWKLLLPAAIVFIGLYLIFRNLIPSDKRKTRKMAEKCYRKFRDEKGNGEQEYTAIFSGQNIKFMDEPFYGADLTAVFGGIECDLRGAIIEEDVYIRAEAIFGAIEIKIPSDVNVKLSVDGILGGVSDKRKQGWIEGAPTIYITSDGIFGGVNLQ